MAIITVDIAREEGWQPSDMLQLVIGSEGAASLTASTPSGGTVVATASPFPDGAMNEGFGNDAAGFGEGEFGAAGSYGLGEGEFGVGAFGVDDAPRIRMVHRYAPTDKCATLPVGVRIVDEAGNVSTVVEKLVHLSDRPRGPRNLTYESTGQPLQVRLNWMESADV